MCYICSMRPLRKVLFIEVIEKEGFGSELGARINPATLGVVKSKGEECSDSYNVGDTVMFITGQEYVCPEIGITFLHDDDVLGVEDGV